MMYLKIILVLFPMLLLDTFSSCSKKKNPVIEIPVKDTLDFSEFAMGMDLSYVNQVEDHGGIFKENGMNKDPFLIMKEHGANMVRFRLWHNPQWIKTVYDNSTPLYSGFEDVARSIKRAKDLGLAVNLDFHYSDIWADPGKQDVPEAWKDITDIKVLCDSVYNYTHGVLAELQRRSILPEMVQIGNEINCGMMTSNTQLNFPALNVCDGNWVNLGKVINSAIQAVRKIDADYSKNTWIALHIADPKNLDWWFTNIIQNGQVNDFDVIGFSYYHIWHTTVAFSELPGLVGTVKAKFGKDIMVMETAYPFTQSNNDGYNNIYNVQEMLTGFPYTIDGQKDFMLTLTQNMITAGAKGIFYWEPAWITCDMKDLWGTGSAWENCAFFDFSGNITKAVDYLDYAYQIK